MDLEVSQERPQHPRIDIFKKLRQDKLENPVPRRRPSKNPNTQRSRKRSVGGSLETLAAQNNASFLLIMAFPNTFEYSTDVKGYGPFKDEILNRPSTKRILLEWKTFFNEKNMQRNIPLAANDGGTVPKDPSDVGATEMALQSGDGRSKETTASGCPSAPMDVGRNGKMNATTSDGHAGTGNLPSHVDMPPPLPAIPDNGSGLQRANLSKEPAPSKIPVRSKISVQSKSPAPIGCVLLESPTVVDLSEELASADGAFARKALSNRDRSDYVFNDGHSSPIRSPADFCRNRITKTTTSDGRARAVVVSCHGELHSENGSGMLRELMSNGRAPLGTLAPSNAPYSRDSVKIPTVVSLTKTAFSTEYAGICKSPYNDNRNTPSQNKGNSDVSSISNPTELPLFNGATEASCSSCTSPEASTYVEPPFPYGRVSQGDLRELKRKAYEDAAKKKSPKVVILSSQQSQQLMERLRRQK